MRFVRFFMCDLNENSDGATNKTRFFCLLFSLVNLERKQTTKNIDPITRKPILSTLAILLPILPLPALSSVLQVMRTSHSDASIVEAVALS